jgi:diacylglycerol kinase family enzyme
VARGGDLNTAEGVVFFQAPWVDVESEGLQVNLDGQPFSGDGFHFDVVERGLPFFMREEPRPSFLK